MDSYASSLFLKSLRCLIISNDKLQYRLGDAVNYELVHVDSSKLPEEIRDNFNNFMGRMTCVQAEGNEGSIEATVKKMPDEEAVKLADLFLSMYGILIK
jgi:rRNA maturation protein Rpf1